VREPNPMLEELARQAVDELAAQQYLKDASPASFARLADVAHRFGVPIEYVLDERERRVREQSDPSVIRGDSER
jgi:hypothetical protein